MVYKYDYPRLSIRHRLDADLTDEQIDEIIEFLLEDTGRDGRGAINDKFAELESIKEENIVDNIRISSITLRDGEETNSILFEVRIKYISLKKMEKEQTRTIYSKLDNEVIPFDSYAIELTR